jgi:hypothetical protein
MSIKATRETQANLCLQQFNQAMHKIVKQETLYTYLQFTPPPS